MRLFMVATRYSSIAKKLVGLVFPIILLCACSPAKEVSFKSAGVTQTFSQGTMAISPDFKDYIYPDATTSGSVSADGENNEESKFLMLSSKSPIESVSKWYRDKFKSENWKIANQQEQPKLISITGSKDKTELSVMITEDNNNTSISLSLAKQVDGNYNDDKNGENFVPNKDTPPTD
jgi:hypothetical protein